MTIDKMAGENNLTKTVPLWQQKVTCIPLPLIFLLQKVCKSIWGAYLNLFLCPDKTYFKPQICPSYTPYEVRT